MTRVRNRKLKDPPLQPLRIPSGWSVKWNKFYDVEPKFKSYDQLSWCFDEDMLYIINDWLQVAVDLGWYPSFKSPGSFGLVAVRLDEDASKPGASRESPLRKFRTRSKEKVVRTLERWMEWYANQKPTPTAKIRQPR